MVVSSLASNHNKDDDVGVNSFISKIPSLSSSKSKRSFTPNMYLWIANNKHNIEYLFYQN